MVTLLCWVIGYVILAVLNLATIGCYSEMLNEGSNGRFNLVDAIVREINLIEADISSITKESAIKMFVSVITLLLIPLVEIIVVKAMIR